MDRETVTYKFGELELQYDKGKGKFMLKGNCCPQDQGSDHFQLIYEALEIATHSKDKFSPEFADMVSELMNLSADWMD